MGQDFFKRIILIFIILSSLGFFEFAIIGGYQGIKLVHTAGIFIIVFFLVIHFFYDKTDHFPTYFKLPVILIFVAAIISMFIALSAHGQSFAITAFAQRSLYFYFLYLLLHFMKIKPEQIQKIILGIGITYAVFYLLQYFIYPAKLFDVRMAYERGTLRIFLPGLGFFTLAYLFSLTRFYITKKPFYIIICIWFLIIFFLFGTRQTLLTVLLITFISLIFSKAVKNKIFLIILISVAIIPVFFIFENIVNNLLNLSTSQYAKMEDNVRLRAATYYLNEFFPNRISYFLGNGASSEASSYGLAVKALQDDYGFYQADIGLVGEYVKYGVLFVIAVFTILIKILVRKLSPDMVYIKYYTGTIILTMFTGFGAFSSTDSVVITCIIMYLCDINQYELTAGEEEEDEK